MPVIPLPSRCTVVSSVDSSFSFSGPVSVSFSGEGADGVAAYLCSYLNGHLNLDCLAEPQEDAGSTEGSGPIWLSVDPDLASLERVPNPQEAYCLRITDSQVVIQARAAHGLFYGVQTLLQLLPPTPDQEIKLGNTQITDSPRFPWRGVLLDVGRHYFSVAFIKKMLDIMAFYKMNRFHWHLTEDQGWRLEVKQFPKLTEFGAWRGPKGRQYGGFYTQQEVREVVAFAAERFIEVIPEIELPGHCCAALACYPNLSCNHISGEYPIAAIESLFTCPVAEGNEETFHFLESVLKEVMTLFPSQYIHIGGDECPKVRWHHCKLCQQRIEKEGLIDEYGLQSWFIGRINHFLQENGKSLIGWDETLEGGLNPGTLVMSWRGITGGVRAAKEGHQVIMTPTSHCYFDYRQSLRSDEPGAWFAMLPLEMVYDYDPIPPQPDYCRQKPILEDEEYIGGSPRKLEVGEEAGESMSEDSRSDGMAREDSDVAELGGAAEVGAPMSRSSKDSAAVEQGEVLFSSSLPAAFQGRPEDDWTLDPRHAPLIIGGQANVWTEYIRDEDTVEYMLLPRLCAMSEALWSPLQDRNWSSFLARLKTQLPHLDARGFKYRPLA